MGETSKEPAGKYSAKSKSSNFIKAIIEQHLAENTHGGRVVTRFPPEPNGYLHIGHAKSICLNFGLALAFNGTCHLRFDDTNPTKEDQEYVDAIKRDIHWLGFDWGEHVYHASDYFQQLYDWAVQLIKDGKAYVCSLNEEEIRSYRGTVKEPGTPSPYRSRSVKENLTLFQAMKEGKFPDGTHVLRAKIDMASANMKMRDPLLYRIRHATHHNTGDTWCIYPMYDYAHCLSDAIEIITHSICTLEFENNRELYDWVIDHVNPPAKPRQYEFARLNLNYTVMSKRKLLELVNNKHVNGWDDPRMPTLAGMRRRGYTPEAIRDFCDRIGVAKANSLVDFTQLEFSLRNDLNNRFPRVMGVLEPLKLIIDDYAEDREETFDAPLYPHDIPKEGSRPLPFGREIFIDRNDFNEHPPKGYHRLAPGREVRLRHAYVVKCVGVDKDEDGNVIAVHCTHDAETLGTNPEDRKIKGTIHWVSAKHGVKAEFRLYDRLFAHPTPDAGDEGKDFKDYMNPESLKIVHGLVEPSIAGDEAGSRYQLERLGYFCSDTVDSKPGGLVFNRTVTLRDSWSKQDQKETAKSPAAEPKKQAPVAATKPKALTKEEAVAEKSPDLAEKFQHYHSGLGLSIEDAHLLTSSAALAAFYEQALSAHQQPAEVAKWMVNELMRFLKDRTLSDLPFAGDDFGALVALVGKGTISSKLAKDVLAEMVQTGSKPKEIVANQGLEQVSDEHQLRAVVAGILQANPAERDRFRQGEKKLQGFFVGQIMKVTKGKADPKLANKLLAQALKNG